MPTKDGVGSNERSNFGESPSPDGLAPNGKSSALMVGQSESLTTELLFENSVLFAEKFNNRILLPGDPAAQGGNQDLPRVKDNCHPRIVALGWSNRQLSNTARTQLFFPGFC